MDERIQDLILDNMLEHVVYYDAGMRILWANGAACKSLNGNLESLDEGRCYKVWYGLEAPCKGCPVKKALESGTFEEGEIKTPDGKVWLVQATPVKKGGAVCGVVELALDMTSLKEAEEKQSKAGALNDLINAMLDPLLVFNIRGVCVFANHAFETTFGLEPKDFMGKHFMQMQGFNLQSQDETVRYAPMFHEALMEGRSGPVELVIARREGQDVHVSGTAGAIRNERNKITHLVVVLHDMSRRKSAESGVVDENRALKAALQATVIVDREGRIVYVDNAFISMWEFASKENAIMAAGEALWQDKSKIRLVVEAVRAQGRWEGEMVARKASGVNFRAGLSAVALPNVDGQLWCVELRD